VLAQPALEQRGHFAGAKEGWCGKRKRGAV
jgi:hypothetical protein